MNNQYNLKGANDPTWQKPCHLGSLLNQGGMSAGGGHMANSDSIPELMNQGGSTKHSGHMDGKKMPGKLGPMMGQG